MNKIILHGTFHQHDYKFGQDHFVNLWEKLNLELCQTNSSYCIELPVSILTISTLQSSINLILGLRKIYCTNNQRVSLHFTTDNIESYYSIQLLPESYIEMLEYTWAFMLSKIQSEQDPFVGFSSSELDQLETIIEYMRQGNRLPKDYINFQYKIFYSTTIDYDKENNTNFCQIFPDLVNFFNECEKL